MLRALVNLMPFLFAQTKTFSYLTQKLFDFNAKLH